MLGSVSRRLLIWHFGLLVLWGCAGSYTGLETDGAAPLSDKEMAAGLRALLMPADLADYEALPDSQRSEWLRMFWQEHDPTPTTSENDLDHLVEVMKREIPRLLRIAH